MSKIMVHMFNRAMLSDDVTVSIGFRGGCQLMSNLPGLDTLDLSGTVEQVSPLRIDKLPF